LSNAVEWYKLSVENVSKALSDERLRTALSRAIATFSTNKAEALRRLPYIPSLRSKAKEIKVWSIAHLDELIDRVKERIEELGGSFYLAKDAKEANEYVARVCLDHDARLVVKGKSMVTEEIRLNKALTTRGIEVVETDLGEWIVQLLGESPSHLIVPAIHVTKEDVATLFSKVTRKKIPPDIPALTRVARSFLREKFVTADIGVTGANVISADTGTIFLIENEGNGRFVSNAPPVHICVTGMEKVVPTVQDAMTIVQLLPVYATGQLMACYVSLITGPSRTADIEMRSTIGVHGPKELHLVLLDNGRSSMIQDPHFKEAAYCIRCGSCLNECPVYREIGGHVMGYRYMGGIGVIFTAFYHGLDKAAPFAFLCSQCGACKLACPLELDIPAMIERLRERLVHLGFVASPHALIKDFIEKHGNPFGEPAEKRSAWLKK